MKPCMYVPLQKSRESVLDCLEGAYLLLWGERCQFGGALCLFGRTHRVCGGRVGPARHLQRLLLQEILRRDGIVTHRGPSTFIHWASPKHSLF